MKHNTNTNGDTKGPPITFRPEASLRDRMEAICIHDERTMTWVIEKCVQGYIETLEQRYGIRRAKP